jgi:hypothetical protein
MAVKALNKIPKNITPDYNKTLQREGRKNLGKEPAGIFRGVVEDRSNNQTHDDIRSISSPKSGFVTPHPLIRTNDTRSDLHEDCNGVRRLLRHMLGFAHLGCFIEIIQSSSAFGMLPLVFIYFFEKSVAFGGVMPKTGKFVGCFGDTTFETSTDNSGCGV